MDLKDKVVVITGGARGLGAAMAHTLAARGAHLALVDIDQDAVDTTAAECAKAGVNAKGYKANVAREDEVIALFDSIAGDFGRLDGLVNNAGITRDALFIKVKDGKIVSRMSMEQWQLVLDVNLTGVFLCGREAATKMIEFGNGGLIVNISSISRAGNMGQTNYSATKAGVEAMAVAWAKELARYGIRANSIAPGFIATEMVSSMKPEALEKLAKQIPLGRLGKPEEIAQTVAFLFENDYTSGRCFEIDAGLRL